LIKKSFLICVLTFASLSCDTQVRIQTPPFGTSLSAPLFGSIGYFNIYAEIGIDINQAKDVKVLESFIRGTIKNASTLNMDISVYINFQGSTPLDFSYKIYTTPPPTMNSNSYYQIFNITLPPGSKQSPFASGDFKPVIDEAIPKGGFWIIVHGRISGIAISPTIILENLYADVTIEKNMENFLPFFDLF